MRYALFFALAFALAACASAPRPHALLEEARAQHAAMTADARVARLAPQELRRAEAALKEAIEAWRTQDDPALVDHLAYVARQRIAIAVATAERIGNETSLAKRPAMRPR